MLCARCGSINSEAAPACGNCGASLKKQFAASALGTMTGQPPVDQSREATARPIDELPTAHVPSVAGSANIAPAAPMPFSEAFPLELAASPPVQTSPDIEGTVSASVSPPMSAPQSPVTPALQSVREPQPPSPDIADYPTKTSVPVPPDTSPSARPERGMGLPEPAPGLSQTSAVSPPLLARPGGLLSLPARTKLGSPLSLAGLNTPPGVATPGQTQGHTPPSQPGISVQPETMRLPGQAQRGSPPSQPGMNTPLPPSSMYAASAQMGTGMAGPSQVGPSRPPSMSGIGTQAQSMGGGGQNWQGNGVSQQPVLGRPGNISPGQLTPDSLSGSARQEGVPAFSTRPAGGSLPGSVRQEEAALSSERSAEAEINTFLRPLPRWARIGGPIAGSVLLLGLVFLNPDWATGALFAALVAGILVVLVGIAAGVRVALGLLKETNPHRRSQVISTSLLILLLLLCSGLGVSQQYSLHMGQGHYFESQQNWAAAIAEYQAAGEKAGNSVDVARVYNEWGEAQSSHQQYAGAVVSFSMVIQYYQQTGHEFSRARTDIIPAYLAWADQAAQQQDYAAATNHYDALLSLVFCSADCMQIAQPKDATAYYHLAEQKLSQHQYAQAVDAYRTLTVRFPRAPEIDQIHAHYAQALLGKGQQQLNTACSDALTTYRLLAKLFADTGEGQQAATALTKPVRVIGHFTRSVPGSPNHPTAFLVQGLVAGIQQYQFPPLLAHAPTASIQSDGSFTFASVPQGTYELVWSSDNTLHFYYASSGQEVLYTAHLGPLCTFNYGNIDQAIPTK